MYKIVFRVVKFMFSVMYWDFGSLMSENVG